MAKLLKIFFFSKLLLALMISNFISLVGLNLFSLRSSDLPYIYLPSFFAVAWVLSRFSMKRRMSSVTIDPLSLVFAGIALVFLTLPRVWYFLEWIPGNSVLAGWDDFARLAELISMTLSDRYPLLLS